MKFAAFGRTKMLYLAIERCLEAGHELVLLGTADAAPEYGAGPREYEDLAARVGCPFFLKRETSDAEIGRLAASSRAEIAISMNWPALVPEPVRSAFSRGVLNAHPGDLPRYRGNACPNWAIINGESDVALTIHQMAEGLDDGPIFAKQRFPLTETTYVADVYAWLLDSVPDAFEAVLDDIESNGLQPAPQPSDPAVSLRVYPRLPRDGEIDWRRDAQDLARLVRASAEPFTGAFTYLDGQVVRVWRAHAEPLPAPSQGIPGQVTEIREGGAVGVLAGTGQLVLTEIQIGADRAAAASITRSARTRFGLDVAAELRHLHSRLHAEPEIGS